MKTVLLVLRGPYSVKLNFNASVFLTMSVFSVMIRYGINESEQYKSINQSNKICMLLFMLLYCEQYDDNPPQVMKGPDVCL